MPRPARSAAAPVAAPVVAPVEEPVSGSSAERSLRLLALLAHEGRALSLADLAAQLGLPKGTAHRICTQLLATGFLARDLDERSFVVGPALRQLAFDTLNHGSVRGLHRLQLLFELPSLLSRIGLRTSTLRLCSRCDTGCIRRSCLLSCVRSPPLRIRLRLHPSQLGGMGSLHRMHFLFETLCALSTFCLNALLDRAVFCAVLAVLIHFQVLHPLLGSVASATETMYFVSPFVSLPARSSRNELGCPFRALFGRLTEQPNTSLSRTTAPSSSNTRLPPRRISLTRSHLPLPLYWTCAAAERVGSRASVDTAPLAAPSSAASARRRSASASARILST